MSPVWLLLVYCLLILFASLAGGLLPLMLTITHRWMEVVVSFVAGVMLGVGLLHLLPHALAELPAHGSTDDVMWALLAGFLVMFLIERFFCFHHHDAPRATDPAPPTDHYAHDVTWSGAALGLSLHSILAGLALAASVTVDRHDPVAPALAGFGTFLVIFLHKPLDSMTLGTLMAKGHWPLMLRHLVNGLFALAIPVGVVLFYLGVDAMAAHGSLTLALALAFSAGVFLCIAMSDLLPELHFHRHDRVKLSLALLAGLAVSVLAGLAESAGHDHGHQDVHQQRTSGHASTGVALPPEARTIHVDQRLSSAAVAPKWCAQLRRQRQRTRSPTSSPQRVSALGSGTTFNRKFALSAKSQFC